MTTSASPTRTRIFFSPRIVCVSKPYIVSRRENTRSTAVRFRYSRAHLALPRAIGVNKRRFTSIRMRNPLAAGHWATPAQGKPYAFAGHRFFSVPRAASKPPSAIVRIVPVSGHTQNTRPSLSYTTFVCPSKSRVASPSRQLARMSITGRMRCSSHSRTMSFVSS